jgi:hypothetical protein
MEGEGKEKKRREREIKRGKRRAVNGRRTKGRDGKGS